MESSENVTSTVYEIGVESELRFVTGPVKKVSVELLSGLAEIFGSELSQNTTYTFTPNSCISIYSWKGCRVKLSGETVESYVISNSLIMILVHIHACLEKQRITASSNSEKGPVSLVLGSGKNAVCHFLLNYAARMGRSPLYIDLDVMQNRCLMPGTISMSKINKPSHVTDGFSRENVCSYLFGYTHPRRNILLYYSLIKTLGEIVEKRLCKEDTSYSSGVIIKGHSWTRHKKGYDIVSFTVNAFSVDVIFVVNNEELFQKLKNDTPSNIKVVYIPSQMGNIEYNEKQNQQNQQNLIWQYFYGSIQNPLTPYVFDVKFSDVQIIAAKRGNLCNIDVKYVGIYNVSIQPDLVNCILGLSYADNITSNLLATIVKGFIRIIRIDMGEGIITVLSPVPAPLPYKILIYSRVKFNKKNCTISKRY